MIVAKSMPAFQQLAAVQRATGEEGIPGACIGKPKDEHGIIDRPMTAPFGSEANVQHLRFV
jgi:hypothetical protein